MRSGRAHGTQPRRIAAVSRSNGLVIVLAGTASMLLVVHKVIGVPLAGSRPLLVRCDSNSENGSKLPAGRHGSRRRRQFQRIFAAGEPVVSRSVAVLVVQIDDRSLSAIELKPK